ncbi:MAG: 30S ribosomal protein S10 [Candidatus Aenigmatarchaeota archaeon]
MAGKAKIKLTGKKHEALEGICDRVKDIAEKYGVALSGPIPLPTKKLKVPVMKTPSGQGTGHGNATWEHYEMRIHKRLIEMEANKRALRRIMGIDIPEEVNIEIELED